jgi:hypothetical protein
MQGWLADQTSIASHGIAAACCSAAHTVIFQYIRPFEPMRRFFKG